MITKPVVEKELAHLNARLSIRRMPTYTLTKAAESRRRLRLINPENNLYVGPSATPTEMFYMLLAIGATLDYILP